jgi:hypothetical protein
LVAVEEHGGGAQYVRFAIWPKCAVISLAVIGALAFLASLAATSGAWAASVAVATVATLVMARMVLEAAGALSLLKRAVDDLIVAEGPST